MRSITGPRIGAWVLATLFLVTACAPPSTEKLVELVNWAALDPGSTCAELRESFQVQYLPLVDYPHELGLAYEEDFVQTERGEYIRVWYIPAPADRGLVLVSPGAVGSLPCFLYATLLLNELGWSVAMYEYQGFGQSTGRADLNSIVYDARAALDWALSRSRHSQATLFAMSLGSIPSIALAVERPDAVNGVVLDSPVALGAQFERFRTVFGDRYESVVAAFEPELYSDDLIGQMKQPLLIYMDAIDVVTPPPTIWRLFDLAAGEKELIEFPGLEHALAQFRQTDIYFARFELFLTRVWGT